MGCASSHEMTLRHQTRHNPTNFAKLARSNYPEPPDAGGELDEEERAELLARLPPESHA